MALYRISVPNGTQKGKPSFVEDIMEAKRIDVDRGALIGYDWIHADYQYIAWIYAPGAWFTAEVDKTLTAQEEKFRARNG